MSLILYHFDGCYYCAKVRKAAHELGVEMEMRDIMKNAVYRDELLSIAGRTQVPCLIIDGRPMHESDDIVAYLKENYS